MATATDPGTGLAYDVDGSGTPVVFLHGLTFDRRTWRPVVEPLNDSVTSIVVDLPAHGESGGEPASLERVAEQIHSLVERLGMGAPVVVGHSMAAGIVALYASSYEPLGLVMVDQSTEILPFAQMLQQVAPMLRGPSFSQVWPRFEESLGIERLPEPTRTMVSDAHRVDPAVVLGYWDQVLSTDPAELQAWIDSKASEIGCPCLAVFGRPVSDGERERLYRLPDVQIEEWLGDGHLVHLVEPPRFADRLRLFVEHCNRVQ